MCQASKDDHGMTSVLEKITSSCLSEKVSSKRATLLKYKIDVGVSII